LATSLHKKKLKHRIDLMQHLGMSCLC